MLRTSQEQNEDLRTYRRRLIQETEMFLRWHLKTDTDPRFNGHGDKVGFVAPHSRSNPQPQMESGTQSHQAGLGTLVEIHVDDTGHVAEEHIEELILKMRNISTRPGDVMLDLSAVRSASKRFLRVLDVFREQLSKQQRNLILAGTDQIRIYRYDG